MWIECSKCGKHKALWAFNKSNNERFNISFYCKECNKKSCSKYKNKGRSYSRKLKPVIYNNYNSMKDIGKDYKYCLRCGASIWSEKEFLDENKARYQDTLLCTDCLTKHVDDYYNTYKNTKKISRYKKLMNKRAKEVYDDLQDFFYGEEL
jgi:hypothetical protein